jgi:maltooligosyltrehalose trehalohydrolase
MLGWYRDLIALRRSTPALSDPDRAAVRVSHDAERGCLRVDRGPISVTVNLGTRRIRVPAERSILLMSPEGAYSDGDVDLSPDGVVILGGDG